MIDRKASVVRHHFYRLPAGVIMAVMASNTIHLRMAVATRQVEDNNNFVLGERAILPNAKARYMLPLEVP